MTRVFWIFLGLFLVLGACTQRMICPAYQSAFIYDKDELRKKFSYFEEDTSPRIYTASKNKYLVAEPVSYQQKIRSLQTVQMKPVPVVVPDSISGEAKDSVSLADFDRAARSIIDSIFIADVPAKPAAPEPDSIYVITKDKEVRVLKYNAPDSLDYDTITGKYITQTPQYYIKEVRYNMEQDNYMWYLRDAIILPDARLAKLQEQGEKSAKERKGIKGFFKNLFKKKPKAVEIDSTLLEAPEGEEEFDFIDETDTVSQAEVPQPGQEDKPERDNLKKKKKKKSNGKSSSRKKRKKSKQVDALPVTPADKKKDEDDGF